MPVAPHLTQASQKEHEHAALVRQSTMCNGVADLLHHAWTIRFCTLMDSWTAVACSGNHHGDKNLTLHSPSCSIA